MRALWVDIGVGLLVALCAVGIALVVVLVLGVLR